MSHDGNKLLKPKSIYDKLNKINLYSQTQQHSHEYGL
jgi:hypothetical protein